MTSLRLLGIAAALVAFAVDQLSKLWLIDSFGISDRAPVALGPYFDVVMAWNPGISYSLLPADTAQGRLGLIVIALVAMLLLGFWMWRARNALTTVALGLVVGGALGNALDRLVHGAVADFFHFHIDTYSFRFSWYVFNLADVAIVAGVVLLLYESFFVQDRPAGAAALER